MPDAKSRVSFVGFESPEQEQQVVDEITPWLFLLPAWCLSLRIERVTGESDDCMSVAIEPKYRRARIEVYCGWFDSPKDRRTENIVHEMFHILTGGVIAFVRDRVVPEIQRVNEPLGAFVEQEFIDIVEGCTEDFALAMTRGRA